MLAGVLWAVLLAFVGRYILAKPASAQSPSLQDQAAVANAKSSSSQSVAVRLLARATNSLADNRSADPETEATNSAGAFRNRYPEKLGMVPLPSQDRDVKYDYDIVYALAAIW